MLYVVQTYNIHITYMFLRKLKLRNIHGNLSELTNFAFYRRRGFEVFHSEKIANDGKIMGSWSMKKML